MNITVEKNGNKLEMAVSGRVDTTTAPELEKKIMDNIDGITELILDFKDLSYTSSAGLRVILKAQKQMNKQGEMKIRNVTDEVMDIFDVTGFSDILTFE